MPSERQPKNSILILLGVCPAKSGVGLRVGIYTHFLVKPNQMGPKQWISAIKKIKILCKIG